MHSDNMTSLEKLTFVYDYLVHLKHNYHNHSIDIDTAIKFVEDVRDSYIQDYK